MNRRGDRDAIRDALARYCRGVDQSDAELIGSAFHPDAVVNQGEYTTTGAEIARRIIDPVRAKSTLAVSHLLGNQLIEIKGRSAWSESYVHVIRRCIEDGKTVDRQTRARYVDSWERRRGAFKIVARTIVFDWRRIDVFDNATQDGHDRA